MNKNTRSVLQFFVSLALLTSSCTSTVKSSREPNSATDLETIYLNKLNTDLLTEHINYLTAVQKRKSTIKNTEHDLNFIDPVEADLNQYQKELNSKLSLQQQYIKTQSQKSLQPTFAKLNKNWRKAKQTFLLHNLDLYQTPRIRTYHFSEADEVELSLNNYFYSWQHNKGAINKDQNQDAADGVLKNQHHLLAQFTCSGPYKFGTQIKSAGSTEKLMWYDQFSNGQRPTVRLNKDSGACEFKFKNPENNKAGSVQFIPNTNSMIDQVSSKYETCVQEDVTQLTGPEKFFYGSENSRLTCPVSVSAYKNLPIPQQTMETKIEALIGQKVPGDFWTAQTPFYKFDMSKAPKFDAVFISYLVFRNDFFGRTIAELLKWHAKNGTEVYIMNSKVIAESKDSQLFLDMMAEYPNIHVQEFAYTTRSGLGLKDMFDQLHRTLHAKIFITYSKKDAKLNKAWIGGRNIHDGFAFEKMPKVAHDDIIDYSKDDSWAFWRDFESIISDSQFVEQIISQYATLWNRDNETLFVRDTVLNLKSTHLMKSQDLDLTKPVARHILTIPYTDNMNLENFISSMIDSAEKEIIFSTPYFRPTQKLSESFARAVQRGVKVKMITRLDLKGDTIDWLLSDVNKAGVNKFLNQIEIYEYTTVNEILHSKVFLIDGKMTFFGAVNLNKRSFYHDIENGILTLGTDLNSEMKKIFSTYFAKSKQITEKQKTTYWKQIIIGIFDKEF